MPGIEGIDNTLFTVIVIYTGVLVVGVWLGMLLWTHRDMRARSRDGLAQMFMVVMAAVLPVAGWLIYLFLRPRETLSEAYERSLEEEALLQEIEEKPSCPGCGHRAQVDWQVCPNCHTRLKKPCLTCGHLLELSWKICPHCAAPQRDYASGNVELPADYGQRPIVSESDPQRISLTRRNPEPQAGPPGSSLEFIDGDDY